MGIRPTMASIELKNINKQWGQFVAVDDFNLTISDNEFLVLLGPSGCGKTTTMRIIAGLEDASSGDIFIDGKRVNGLEPKDRDVAMVFQSYGLYPNMNVYENIRFPLKVRKIDQSIHDERVKRASAMVELDEFLHRKPAELSGGQRQRVALDARYWADRYVGAEDCSFKGLHVLCLQDEWLPAATSFPEERVP